jgi:hypothetical protein
MASRRFSFCFCSREIIITDNAGATIAQRYPSLAVAIFILPTSQSPQFDPPLPDTIPAIDRGFLH